jgi:hypothetical protein
MAEIEFFAIEEEIIELVRWLLDRQCELVPDCHYESSRVNRMTKEPAIRSLAESTPHFFVIREDWVESPLSVREVTTTDKHFFYIDPRTGGPTLQFYWGRQFETDARKHLSATWLSSYRWYEDSVSHARKKPPKALAGLYSEFAKTVRGSRTRIKPGRRAYWISPHVAELVRAGMILVGLEGMPADQVLGVSGR